MRTQYVCTWTIALWGDSLATLNSVSRKLQKEIQHRFDVGDVDLLQSSVIGPILLPREEDPCDPED